MINNNIQYTQGDQAYAYNNWNVARDHYSNAIRYTENAPSVLMKRAMCSYRLGDWYETIADTGKVLKLDENNIEAMQVRGNSYYILGEFEAAKNHFR